MFRIGARRLVAAGVTTMALAGGGTAVTGGAAYADNPVCFTNQNTIVRSTPELKSTNHLYTLETGRGFRDDGAANGWVRGHGNGLPEGWVPRGNLDC